MTFEFKNPILYSDMEKGLSEINRHNERDIHMTINIVINQYLENGRECKSLQEKDTVLTAIYMELCTNKEELHITDEDCTSWKKFF